MEKIGHLSLRTTKTVTHWEQSHQSSEGNSIYYGSEQLEKWRSCFRSCLIRVSNQIREDCLMHIFVRFFFLLLSAHNSKHNQGIWVLQSSSKQIVLNDRVSTQAQSQDPLWRPFLPLQRGHSMGSSARDLIASQKGDAPCPPPRAPILRDVGKNGQCLGDLCYRRTK